MANPDLAFDALRKPERGAAGRQRRLDRRAVENREDKEKAKVRKRDKRCRWPRCDCHGLKLRAEVAHLEDKGMGGDHGVRTRADLMILLCVSKHQGRVSLHSGDREIKPQQANKGTNGPCDFYARNFQNGQMELVASERCVGVPMTRSVR